MLHAQPKQLDILAVAYEPIFADIDCSSGWSAGWSVGGMVGLSVSIAVFVWTGLVVAWSVCPSVGLLVGW